MLVVITQLILVTAAFGGTVTLEVGAPWTRVPLTLAAVYLLHEVNPPAFRQVLLAVEKTLAGCWSEGLSCEREAVTAAAKAAGLHPGGPFMSFVHLVADNQIYSGHVALSRTKEASLLQLLPPYTKTDEAWGCFCTKLDDDENYAFEPLLDPESISKAAHQQRPVSAANSKNAIITTRYYPSHPCRIGEGDLPLNINELDTYDDPSPLLIVHASLQGRPSSVLKPLLRLSSMYPTVFRPGRAAECSWSGSCVPEKLYGPSAVLRGENTSTHHWKMVKEQFPELLNDLELPFPEELFLLDDEDHRKLKPLLTVAGQRVTLSTTPLVSLLRALATHLAVEHQFERVVQSNASIYLAPLEDPTKMMSADERQALLPQISLANSCRLKTRARLDWRGVPMPPLWDVLKSTWAKTHWPKNLTQTALSQAASTGAIKVRQRLVVIVAVADPLDGEQVSAVLDLISTPASKVVYFVPFASDCFFNRYSEACYERSLITALIIEEYDNWHAMERFVRSLEKAGTAIETAYLAAGGAEWRLKNAIRRAAEAAQLVDEYVHSHGLHEGIVVINGRLFPLVRLSRRASPSDLIEDDYDSTMRRNEEDEASSTVLMPKLSSSRRQQARRNRGGTGTVTPSGKVTQFDGLRLFDTVCDEDAVKVAKLMLQHPPEAFYSAPAELLLTQDVAHKPVHTCLLSKLRRKDYIDDFYEKIDRGESLCITEAWDRGQIKDKPLRLAMTTSMLGPWDRVIFRSDEARFNGLGIPHMPADVFANVIVDLTGGRTDCVPLRYSLAFPQAPSRVQFSVAYQLLEHVMASLQGETHLTRQHDIFCVYLLPLSGAATPLRVLWEMMGTATKDEENAPSVVVSAALTTLRNQMMGTTTFSPLHTLEQSFTTAVQRRMPPPLIPNVPLILDTMVDAQQIVAVIGVTGELVPISAASVWERQIGPGILETVEQVVFSELIKSVVAPVVMTRGGPHPKPSEPLLSARADRAALTAAAEPLLALLLSNASSPQDKANGIQLRRRRYLNPPTFLPDTIFDEVPSYLRLRAYGSGPPIVGILDPYALETQAVTQVLRILHESLDCDIKVVYLPFRRENQCLACLVRVIMKDNDAFKNLPMNENYAIELHASRSWRLKLKDSTISTDEIKFTKKPPKKVHFAWQLSQLLSEVMFFSPDGSSPQRLLTTKAAVVLNYRHVRTSVSYPYYEAPLIQGGMYTQLQGVPGTAELTIQLTGLEYDKEDEEQQAKRPVLILRRNCPTDAQGRDVPLPLGSLLYNSPRHLIVNFRDDYEPPAPPSLLTTTLEWATEKFNNFFFGPPPKRTKWPQEAIHIFSYSTGTQEEWFLQVLILSAIGNSKEAIVFWVLEDWVNVDFRVFAKRVTRRSRVKILFVSCAWPAWVSMPEDKQTRAALAKIIMLDLLVPPSVNRLIVITPTAVVQGGPLENLWEVRLHSALWAFPTHCDHKPATQRSRRFWETSKLWKDHLNGRPYYSSSLFVVDMVSYRRQGAGDVLRHAYNQLMKANPYHTQNIDDQHLINVLQNKVPIQSLPEDWYWSEDWCGKEILNKARILFYSGSTPEKTVLMSRTWKIHDAQKRKLMKRPNKVDEL